MFVSQQPRAALNTTVIIFGRILQTGLTICVLYTGSVNSTDFFASRWIHSQFTVLVRRSLSSHESQRTNPRKTPIQILHEYGTKSGNLPVYVMEKAEGEAHQPHFVFSVRIGDVDCSGELLSRLVPRRQLPVGLKPFYGA